MGSSLDDWQSRLDQHFSLLHRQRESRPLFALEHGLNAGEIDSVAQAVRADVTARSPSGTHSLAWVVYAAEVGYGYSGDEYWQTFELKTPGWIYRGDRSWLRDRFQWFSETYGGAAPPRAMGRSFLDHLLANHSCDSTPRSPTSVGAHSLRTASFLLCRNVRKSCQARRLRCSSELERHVPLPKSGRGTPTHRANCSSPSSAR